MDEYIDKSTVIAMIDEYVILCKEYGFPVDIFDMEMLKKRIEQIPAADVAPVVHGRWDDSFDGITPVCSVCGRTHKCFNRTPNYCPNCGAKMDEE